MRNTFSIQIRQPVETVFDLVTNPNRVHEWSEYARRIEILSRGPWGGYNQARWLLVRGNLEVETIETVLEYEAPFLFASKTHILRATRHINTQAQDSLPPIDEILFPAEHTVEKRFNNQQMTLLLQLNFIPEGKSTTTLRMTRSSHFGFFVSTVMWFRGMFIKHPDIKTLEAIKKAAESNSG
ncbi:SRPBCC family protein [Profundibacter amoris]|uniref:SRPBCC family protein n=1 Tax=Profundibacter amoris TaxID=2171755 RepID=A0A347UHM8_9RHOB|nr:SRPBCC family protein [Profundibacter amoris]AXX98356.1 SRPBCC family protein [Profundibacter amoris]